MATTTITWKNNSTDQSPTGTKIERYEDFPKGHEHATAPVEVANGNTGGLDPTLANGTYVDSSISGGKYSTVVFFLTLEVAKRLNKLPLKVVFLDQEA